MLFFNNILIAAIYRATVDVPVIQNNSIETIAHK